MYRCLYLHQKIDFRLLIQMYPLIYVNIENELDKLGYERVHGGYSFGDKNETGESILDFALASDLMVANTIYKKRKDHLITFKSGSVKSQIDYFIVRKVDCLKCNDCKVIPGENLASQHRILVLDLCFRR